MVPCSVHGIKFVLWIISYRNDVKFTINAFIDKTNGVLMDLTNRNSLSSYIKIVEE